MKFGVGTPTVCASPPSGRFSPPEPVPTLGPVRGMGPTSEAKWEGWSEAEGRRRRAAVPCPRGKRSRPEVTQSAGPRAAAPRPRGKKGFAPEQPSRVRKAKSPRPPRGNTNRQLQPITLTDNPNRHHQPATQTDNTNRQHQPPRGTLAARQKKDDLDWSSLFIPSRDCLSGKDR